MSRPLIGLRGAEINDIARLATIDIYTALVEKRTYRLPLTHDRAFSLTEDMEK